MTSEANPNQIADRPTVSFVVIAFNEEAGIENTLAGIVAQENCELAEVIVVDDASVDATALRAERFAENDSRVRVVRHLVNRGRGAARLRGFQEASGQLIAYVDADIVLPTTWFERCLTALRTQDLAAVGGVAVPDGDVTYLYRRFQLEPRVVSSTTTVTGNNGLYRREVFERVSFDPELREGEDIAFNHAVASMNARMETVHDLYVRHEENKSFVTSVGWLFQSGVGATRMLARYRRVRLPDIASFSWTAASAVSLVGVFKRRPLTLAAPLSISALAAASHLHRSFVLDRRRPLTMLCAFVTDTIFLTAYFLGRIAGLRKL